MPAPPETDVAKIRKYCRARVPARLRHQVRVEAAIRGNSVTIFNSRPPGHPDLTEWSKVRVAQLRYSPSTHYWSLYWADRNGRWHRYDDLDPGPVDTALNEIACYRANVAPRVGHRVGQVIRLESRADHV